MKTWLWPHLAGLLVVAPLLGACSSKGDDPCGPPVARDKAEWPADIKPYKHIVVVIEENKGPEQIFCEGCAPFLNKLATEGAYFTQMFGEEHPSEGNYLWLFSGDNHKVGYLDKLPETPLDADNLGRALTRTPGLSFIGYVENLPNDIMVAAAPPRCFFNNECIYARRHVPWLSFTDFAGQQGRAVTKSFELSWPRGNNFDSLPTVSFVIPNLYNDMHSGRTSKDSVARGSNWLEANLKHYYEWAKLNDSLLVVTFDENDDSDPLGLPEYRGPTDPFAPPGKEGQSPRVRRNQILTIMAGARIRHRDGGYGEGKGITHVNLLRTIEAMYGLKKSGGQQGCAAAGGISDHFITDVFE